MAKRLESPSSINTFKQCPRKYYHQYIQKLPTFPSIHTVRGNIAHATLEDFYNLDIKACSEETYPYKCRESIQKLFIHYWSHYKPQLLKLSLSPDQEKFYFEETMLMLMNWVNHFITDLHKTTVQKNCSVEEAFVRLTPVREQEYHSDNLYVHGFIDAIHHFDDEVHIIDYKTNSSTEIKDSILLQLGIYSLLYSEKHGKVPSKVGIFFLRSKLKLLNVDPQLLDLARKEIELIHSHTSRTDKLDDYPKKTSPLCRWSGGQCDFYNVCDPYQEKSKS